MWLAPVGIKVKFGADKATVPFGRKFCPLPTPQLPDEAKLEQLKTVVCANTGESDPRRIVARNTYVFMRLFIVIPLKVGSIESKALTPARTLATQETKFSASSTRKDTSQCASPILVIAAVAASHNPRTLQLAVLGKAIVNNASSYGSCRRTSLTLDVLKPNLTPRYKSSCNNIPTKESRAAAHFVRNAKMQAGNQSKPLSLVVNQVIADKAVSVWPLAG
jgi:hypothetical protein